MHPIVKTIIKPFRTGTSARAALAEALREQADFEIAHPIAYSVDQREQAVTQRLRAKGFRISKPIAAAITQAIHSPVGP